MHPKVSKIFLDSRYTVNDDGKTFDLQSASLVLDPRSRVWLSEFTCVASWDTLDPTNNQLEILEAGLARIIALPTGAYDINSLRIALENALNDGPPVEMGVYTVDLVSTGSSGSTFRSFLISNSGVGQFQFRPQSQAPMSTLLSIMPFPHADYYDHEHKTGFIDIRRVHSIYMHVSGLGAYGSYGCRGNRTIMAKVPVLAGYGGVVHWQASGSDRDAIEVGVPAPSTVRIELRDAAGNELDLHGTSWSCTLLFER